MAMNGPSNLPYEQMQEEMPAEMHQEMQPRFSRRMVIENMAAKQSDPPASFQIQVLPTDYGSEQPDVPASNELLSHELGSECVGERCKQTSKWTSVWPIAILGCSEP